MRLHGVFELDFYKPLIGAAFKVAFSLIHIDAVKISYIGAG